MSALNGWQSGANELCCWSVCVEKNVHCGKLLKLLNCWIGPLWSLIDAVLLWKAFYHHICTQVLLTLQIKLVQLKNVYCTKKQCFFWLSAALFHLWQWYLPWILIIMFIHYTLHYAQRNMQKLKNWVQSGQLWTIISSQKFLIPPPHYNFCIVHWIISTMWGWYLP